MKDIMSKVFFAFITVTIFIPQVVCAADMTDLIPSKERVQKQPALVPEYLMRTPSYNQSVVTQRQAMEEAIVLQSAQPSAKK